MAGEVDIANMALRHLGQGVGIQDLESEMTEAAIACRAFFDFARDKALSDVPWPFAREFATLALVEDDPTEEWSHSYRVPVDSLVVRRIRSGTRRDNQGTAVPFIIGQDADGGLLFTDESPCPVEYTKRVEDPNKWSADFSRALSYLLAMDIAPGLAAGDNTGIVRRCEERYMIEIQKAIATSINGQQFDVLPPSSFERART